MDTQSHKKKIVAAVISSYAYIRGHNNYGSILQYYALQQYLTKFNVEAYWIRYMFSPVSMYRHLLKRIIRYLYHGFRIKNCWNHIRTQREFQKFMHNKCRISRVKYKSISSLKENPPQADLYVTGSDQVWGGWLEPNYLTFAPQGKPRVAYAASFGKQELTEEHQLRISSWVKSFDAVSVREASGVEICRKMGIEAVHLLDPTLLLDVDDYLPSNVIRSEKNEYIFCYFINETNPQNLRLNDIIQYSEKERLKLKITAIEGPELVVPSQYLCQYSPEGWLNHYKYAKCIFTNTFHGVVFCIIFRKQFCVFTQTGFSVKQNERLYSILKLFELEGRILEPGKSVSDVIGKKINWEKIELIKSQSRIQTENFWHEILNKF